MANYLTTDTELTSVANAIRTKGGTSGNLIYPAGFVSAIENIKTGGATENDVNFYDDLANNCRGGIAYSYSAAEFATLTEMPANPDHSNFTTHGISIPMTSQGWNWSLTDAKAYVAKYGKLNIGQTYVPTDGKSHYICYVPEDAPVERWNTEIDISVSGGNVNWQIDDGTVSTASGNITVTFSSVGWHDVKIEAPNGVTYYPYYSSSSKSNELKGKLQKIIQVFLGNATMRLGMCAFYHCYSLISITISNSIKNIDTNSCCYCCSLTSITIPNGITSIQSSAFQNCYSIISIAIPNGITSIQSSAFSDCYGLPSITIPDGVTSIDNYVFLNCYSLASFTIPDGATSVGTSAFSTCYNLTSITIPDNVTRIGANAFYSCRSLASITIPDGITSIGDNAFSYCYSLTSIAIPDGVTSIGAQVFLNCYSLASLTIPDGVTSIGSNAFSYCHSLTSLIIPDSITSIDTNAFRNSFSIKNIIIETSTPPTLANVNAFLNLMPDYSIIVPAGSLSAYTSATNWSSAADHIVEASA